MTRKVLAVIPARAGSKGILHKNLRDLAGKPLIAWTIEAALACSEIERVILSTDSQEIAGIARDLGAEVPFLRPPELAEDTSLTTPVILHVLQWLARNEGYQPSQVMCLQPTSPLCSALDMTGAIELLAQKKGDTVVSVTASQSHPYFTKKVDEDQKVTDFISLKEPIFRRQDLPPLYTLNGAIYLARRDILIDYEVWYTSRTYGYIMPEDRSLDINNPWDLYLANLILQDKKKNSEKDLIESTEKIGV